MNEHLLTRVLEQMERQGREGSSIGDVLGALGITVAIAFALATADFHKTFGIAAGDIHQVAVTLLALSFALTIVLSVRAVGGARARMRRETPEQVVARMKRQATELDERLRTAESEVGDKD